MHAPGWRTSLVVDGFTLSGHRVPVVAGLVEAASGGVQLAVRLGEDGEPVILPLQAGAQLVVNVRELMLELVRLEGQR